MLCPTCHQDIQEDALYCPHCGEKLNKCPHCQKPLMPNAKFCTYCGQSVIQQSSSQERIGGYYQPIQDNVHQETEKETIQFQDIPTKKKVNKLVVGGSVLLLVVASIVSYLYLKNTPAIEVADKQNETVEKFEIGGNQTSSTLIGNINQAGHVYQYNDKVYIVNDQGKLVSMDKALSQKTVIIDDQVEYVNIVNDTIYYTNKDNHICSSTINGDNQKVILNVKAYYMVVKDEKIYYQSDTDGESIYVYDLKTNQNTKLNDRHSYNLNVVDQDIYYTSTDGIYRIGIDGKGDEKLISGECSQVIYQDDKLYYTENANQLRSYDIKTKKMENVVNERSQLANITDQYIFYYSTEGLKKYDFKTQTSEVIYNSNPQYVEVLGDKLVLTLQSGQDSYRIIMDFNGKQQQRLFVGNDGSFI